MTENQTPVLTGTLSLADGRTIRMRLATVNEQLAIMDLPLARTKAAQIERLRFWRDLFRDATVETSWGGDVGELTSTQMFALVGPWLELREEEAVPFVSGSSLDTPPSEARSPEQTADGNAPQSRRSSRLSKSRRAGTSRRGRSPAKNRPTT